jgi:hypothetical protein
MMNHRRLCLHLRWNLRLRMRLQRHRALRFWALRGLEGVLNGLLELRTWAVGGSLCALFFIIVHFSVFLKVWCRYTERQQKRLHVDQHGNKVAIAAAALNPVKVQKKIPVKIVSPPRAVGHDKPALQHPNIVNSQKKKKKKNAVAAASSRHVVGRDVHESGVLSSRHASARKAAPSSRSTSTASSSHSSLKRLPSTSSMQTRSAAGAASAASSDAFDSAQRALALYHAAKSEAKSKAATARAAADHLTTVAENAVDLAHVAEAEAVKVRRSRLANCSSRHMHPGCSVCRNVHILKAAPDCVESSSSSHSSEEAGARCARAQMEIGN